MTLNFSQQNSHKHQAEANAELPRKWEGWREGQKLSKKEYMKP
jgi:hypothetical protein